MRSRPRGAAALAACALAASAVLPTLAAAAPLDSVIRVEGAERTLLGESTVVVDDEGVETFFDEGFLPLETPRSSAFFQLSRATSAAGLALGWQRFQDFIDPNAFAAFVTRIGPEAGEGALGWNFRVNGATPTSFAANQVLLNRGDVVLWFYGSGGERTLDLAVSADTVPRGTPFQVTVISRDATGAAIPAAGARVAYGAVVEVTDAAGRATFVGQAAGVREVAATRGGEIRSPRRPVCSWETDPTACNLPPVPPPPAPPAVAVPGPGAEPTAAAADTTPPGSRIEFPRAGRTHRAVRALAGQAGPDRSDVVRVEVALAQRVGTLCRFRGPDRRLGGPGPCRDQRYLPARSVGGSWLLPLRGDLAPGVWRMWSRAVDGAGNREGAGVAGVNTLQFRVAPRRPAPRGS